MRRAAAFLIAALCCRLSFCHLLATAGPDASWSTGRDRYLAQSFGQEWQCDVARSACWAARGGATGVPGLTFVGIELWALCSALACIMLAYACARRRAPIARALSLGILGAGWLGFVADVTALATPARAAWGIALCPIAIALLGAMQPKHALLPQARAQTRS